MAHPRTARVTLPALLLCSACIGPQQKPCDCSAAAQTESAESDTATSAVEIPPGIKPTGPKVYDGNSNMLSSDIDPPGSWFAMNDGSPKGSMVPASTGDIPNEANGTLHSQGSGYGEWGGGIGFNFVGNQMITPLDATAFKGIKFKASGKGPMHVGLATVATMPEFGVCTKCYDHFAVDINLTSEMKEYTYEWGDLRQSGWGSKAKLDPATLVGLNFTSRGPTAWDFTLDDIEFIQ